MLAKDGVREWSSFFISISNMSPNTLEEFFKKVEKYINYENVLEVEKLKMVENQNMQKKWQGQKMTSGLSWTKGQLIELVQSTISILL